MKISANNTCPVCDSKDISYDSAIEPRGDRWLQACSCPLCGSTWDNVYALVEDGYDNINPATGDGNEES